MKIVIDTNVIASGVFFGGNPRKLIELLLQNGVAVYASPEILDEYSETFDYLRSKYPDRPVNIPLS